MHYSGEFTFEVLFCWSYIWSFSDIYFAGLIVIVSTWLCGLYDMMVIVLRQTENLNYKVGEGVGLKTSQTY